MHTTVKHILKYWIIDCIEKTKKSTLVSNVIKIRKNLFQTKYKVYFKKHEFSFLLNDL